MEEIWLRDNEAMLQFLYLPVWIFFFLCSLKKKHGRNIKCVTEGCYLDNSRKDMNRQILQISSDLAYMTFRTRFSNKIQGTVM